MTNKSTGTVAAHDTRDRILDAAEALFIEHGFAATSVRAIAHDAGVNLAASNYHFGSKNGLFAAVLHRRVAPVNEQRLANLNHLKSNDSKHQLTVRDILQAFFSPLVDGLRSPCIPALLGRIYGEPASFSKPILQEEFQPVTAAFMEALSRALPEVPAEELRWRFHFMIGSMTHLLRFHAPFGRDSSLESFIEGMPRLIEFVEKGLTERPPTNNGTHHV